MKKRTFAIGIISIIFFELGILMKLLRIIGANGTLMFGLLLFLIGFMLLFFMDKVSIESRKNGRVSLFLLLMIVILAFSFALSQIMRWGALYLGEATMLVTMIFFVFFASQLEGRKHIIRRDRQLASILFTDIVGYTALMGKNEEVALQKLDESQRIQKRLIRKYRGTWLKDLGDGMMSVFYTASEAMLCAIEIQQEINTKTDVRVRIGIHVSEIVFTDNDIFGDGVNVASRIANQAGSGEIYFSESVHHNIRNREEFEITNVGETALKNVAYKLNLYKISS